MVQTQAESGVRASNATADTPDPAAFSTPEPYHKPDTLENIEDAILAPKDGLSEVDPAQIVEYVGFMRQDCGLDFGWGSSTIMQYVMEHLHITFGLSWGAAILTTALLLRVVLAKPFLTQQRLAEKLRLVNPELRALRDQQKELVAAGDRKEAMMVGNQLRAVYKRHNINPIKMFLPLLIQIPFQWGGFRVLRNAASLPVPSFETESFLWIPSLTANDYTYIIPALFGLFTFRAMWRAMKAQPADTTMAGMMRTLGILLPLVSVAFCAYQQAAVQLWFLCSGGFAALQGELLASTRFRKSIGLGPVPVPSATPPPPTDAFGYRMQKEISGMKMYNDGRVIKTTARPVPSPATQGYPFPAFENLTKFVEPEKKKKSSFSIGSLRSEVKRATGWDGIQERGQRRFEQKKNLKTQQEYDTAEREARQAVEDRIKEQEAAMQERGRSRGRRR